MSAGAPAQGLSAGAQLQWGPGSRTGAEHCGGVRGLPAGRQTRAAHKQSGVGMVFITRCVQPPPCECFCRGGLLNLYYICVAPRVIRSEVNYWSWFSL